MNALTSPKTHVIMFKTIRIGGEYIIPEAVYITEAQYNGLKNATTPLVEIEGQLYSIAEIRNVTLIPRRRQDYPQRWQYDSDLEFEEAKENFNK